jgi:hypothetical protein
MILMFKKKTPYNQTVLKSIPPTLDRLPEKACQQEVCKTAGIINRKPNIGATKTLWESPSPPQRRPKEGRSMATSFHMQRSFLE